MRVPVVFMRGGTSKGLFFHERDLPGQGPERDALLLSAMGSPDPYGRQLNGMGGGISSLSKIIIVRRAEDAQADVEFLHGQVSVDRALIDYSANCGNLSAAVGPFAIDEGLAKASVGDATTVRIRNLNTGVMLHGAVPVRDGKFQPHGDFVMSGISGTASRIALEYLHPGFEGTSLLYPSGAVAERIGSPSGEVSVTCAVATVPMAWLRAGALGLDPAIMPDAFDANRPAMAAIEAIRRAAAVRMRVAASDAAVNESMPKIGVLGAPRDYVASDGQRVRADEFDVMARVVSMGRAHKAVPLIAAMCLAAVCQTEGSIADGLCRPIPGPDLRIGTPAGVVTVGALLDRTMTPPGIAKTMVYSTARRLMDGWVTADV